MAMASCSQARSLSPTHAAILAKHTIMRVPLIASFSTGSSSTARRPSRSASSFRPRAASIKPSTHRAPASSGWARTSFSCSARAAVKAARALASSFVIRAIRPSTKRGLYFTVSLPRLFSPNAAKALAAAAGSRSARAQSSHSSATLWIAPGSFARISIDQLMQGPGICFPVEFDERARDFRLDVVRLDSQHAVQDGFFVGDSGRR